MSTQIAQIQERRGAAALWTSVNPIPAQAQVCYETDTGKVKIGNGTDAWNDLPYFGEGGGAVDSVNGQTGEVELTTTEIPEGDNLYFTPERAADAAPVQSVNGAEGAVSLDSDNIPEGDTNLYFTDARARAAVAAQPLQLVNMTTVQRNALTPVPGMVIFNTTTASLEVYNGSAWV